MIHHFLNESEIQRLTELHKVKFCGNCAYCRNTKCIPKNIYVDNNISCEKFSECHNYNEKEAYQVWKK